MNAIRCETPRDFLGRAEAFLLADEACHNLLLGVPAAHTVRHRVPGRLPYFAVVTNAGGTVAAAMMIQPHRLVLSRTEFPQALRLIAQDLRAAGMIPPGVHGPIPISERFAREWEDLSGQRYEQGLTQRIYRLTHVRPVSNALGRLRHATRADRPVLVAWMRAFTIEAFGKHAPPTDPEQIVDRRLLGTTEGLYVWDHDGPRALVGHAGATPHGIRIGPVYTPPEHRGHGYGTTCTAALSQLLLNRGYGFCCLYVDLANPAANRIYQRIGYEPVCDVAEYRFLPPPVES